VLILHSLDHLQYLSPYEIPRSLNKMRWNLLAFGVCLSLGTTLPTEQAPLLAEPVEKAPVPESATAAKDRALQGRFLHITGMVCFRLGGQSVLQLIRVRLSS